LENKVSDIIDTRCNYEDVDKGQLVSQDVHCYME